MSPLVINNYISKIVKASATNGVVRPIAAGHGWLLVPLLCAVAICACAGKEIPKPVPAESSAKPAAGTGQKAGFGEGPVKPDTETKKKTKPGEGEAKPVVTAKQKAAELAKEQLEEFRHYRKKNTVKSYYAFIAKYPHNRWVAEAKLYAEELEFGAYSAHGTTDSYAEFIVKHPRNRFLPTAKAAIEDLAFERVKEANSVVGYAEFLRDYSTSPLAPEAERRKDILEYAPYKEKGTVDALEEFVKSYPLSSFREEALARISEMEQLRVKGETAKICEERKRIGNKYDCEFVSFEPGKLTVIMKKPDETEEGQRYLIGGPGYVEEMERRYTEWKADTFERLLGIPGVASVEEQ